MLGLWQTVHISRYSVHQRDLDLDTNLALYGFVTLGNSLNLSKPYFSHLHIGDDWMFLIKLPSVRIP